MSEVNMLDMQMRAKALDLACEGADPTAAVDSIILIATAYYNFLKGTTNE